MIAAWRLVPCPTCGVAEHKNCRSLKDRNRRVRTPHAERWRAIWKEGQSVGECVFCQIVAGEEPATVVRRWNDALAIVPRAPVVDGHVLVIPTCHVRDVVESPEISAQVMMRAAEMARSPCNIITSAGREATQSVFHLHLHIVPRSNDDGLALPWHSGRIRKN